MFRIFFSPNQRARLILTGLLVTALLILAGIQTAQAEPPAAPLPQNGGPYNAECLSCHSGFSPDHVLPSGESLEVTIDPTIYGASVHGSNNIGCVSCHTDITGYPHPANPGVENVRDYVISYRDTCKPCHTEQYENTLDSIHYEIFLAGNENAPMCSDCHDPHAQGPVTGLEGEEQAMLRSEISEICSQCHSGIYEEYTQGVHGDALRENNPDVPTCIDCHGVHNIPDPRTAQFRLSSVNLCADCHTDETIMSKYGLSTRVLDTYIDDFHGKTVTLFEPKEPNQYPNTPVCYDCHGMHRIISVEDPEEGLQVKENLLVTCQKCHPEATSNFPTSWLGHYTPDREKFPLVYWVNVFYNIFVPTVLGGMAIFVASDIFRKIFRRGKRTPSQDAPDARNIKKGEE